MSEVKVLYVTYAASPDHPSRGNLGNDEKRAALLDELAKVIYEDMKVGAKDSVAEDYGQDECDKPEHIAAYVWNCVENWSDSMKGGNDFEGIYEELDHRLTKLAQEEFK